jgi:predicted nucleic acid-binding protein
VKRVVVLDAGPLGLATNPASSTTATACRQWVEALVNAGWEIAVPEIVDYEVRRELIRANRKQGLVRLDDFVLANSYLPLTTMVMRQAAALWAAARQAGQPTAGDKTIDTDMILIAQAMALNDPQAIIATTNPGHITRYFTAEDWQLIKP